ncbi:uncharacterized protein LAJ45_00429 [Morchella importuna]|uniref:uncharacterized protein n=1 Tax=Morchella importuna TaxID=1174673 RepID=UPI001E8E150F|nr:uncharacterized protein LAJ45_00429 [Morchella importuna]KAH8155419.1 hypothetical protein LAJ45_00429 [Morchella importuna]
MSSQQFIAIDENPEQDQSYYSGYDSESSEATEKSTNTLKSSIFDYRFENGRRYHAYRDGKYMFPNDDAEQERLDIIHHTYLLLLNGELHMAPIVPEPTRILDIGTGTGIWAIDAGDRRYPDAEVIGTDLSPIQPAWVPPNVHFQIDDAESEWTWAKESFDMIHIRHLSGAIKDWDALLKEVYKNLKPGGWVDLSEYDMHLFSDDGTYHEGLGLYKFYDLVNQAAAESGRVFNIAGSLKASIEAAGFINVHQEMRKIPVGTWPADQKQKTMGAYILLTAESAFDAFGMRLLTNFHGMEVTEVNKLVNSAKKDVHDRRIHSYSKHHLYWAQKPLP